jgi:hypothetical protein
MILYPVSEPLSTCSLMFSPITDYDRAMDPSSSITFRPNLVLSFPPLEDHTYCTNITGSLQRSLSDYYLPPTNSGLEITHAIAARRQPGGGGLSPTYPGKVTVSLKPHYPPPAMAWMAALPFKMGGPASVASWWSASMSFNESLAI